MSKVNIDDLLVEAYLNDTAKYTNKRLKAELRISFHNNPKRYGVCVSSSRNGHYGVGSSCNLDMPTLLHTIRDCWYTVTKENLEEVISPQVRTWYFSVRGGKYYPFTKSSVRPVLADFLIECPNTGEQEYFFDIPYHLSPELDYPRDGNTIYIPKLDMTCISDYPPNLRK